jgi:hypothetical protein
MGQNRFLALKRCQTLQGELEVINIIEILGPQQRPKICDFNGAYNMS